MFIELTFIQIFFILCAVHTPDQRGQKLSQHCLLCSGSDNKSTIPSLATRGELAEMVW